MEMQGVDDDFAVAERLRAQDPAIIQELVQHHGLRLRRYLLRLTANREQAEDLAQETWVRVITRGSQFKGDSRFVTWLFAIARNLAADRFRRTARVSSIEELAGHGEQWQLLLTDETQGAEERYEASEQARILSKAFGSLDRSQRKLLQLRFYREMTLSELARETNASLPTVKARLYRALQTLRRQVAAIHLERAAC
jgi:RNA polymerase sigma-70 factor, ECF subfamily